MPSADGPKAKGLYQPGKRPSQVTRTDVLGKSVPVYVKGSWSGLKFGKPINPKYKPIPGIPSFSFSLLVLIIRLGGFVIAPNDERGKLRFESPFEMEFMWRGDNSEVLPKAPGVRCDATQVNVSLFV